MASCKLRVLCLLLVATAGCGYGQVSPAAYDYAQALYALSNRQASERVEEIAAQIAAAAESGDITPREAGWLGSICDKCREADWPAAQKAARAIMQDQVRR